MWLVSRVIGSDLRVFYSTPLEVFQKLSPSDPCVPGFGILLFLFLIPVVCALVVRNLILSFSKDKKYLILVCLHIVIAGLFVILS